MVIIAASVDRILCLTHTGKQQIGGIMGIDKQSDVSANIQIGPTDQGMVRIYIEADDGTELPMDFDPEEALDIAEELRAAAEAVRAMGQGAGPRKKK